MERILNDVNKKEYKFSIAFCHQVKKYFQYFTRVSQKFW